MLDTIIQNLESFPVNPIVPGANQPRQAAVLLALTREERPEVVLIRRADHLKDHPGEVAFPGGMWEELDNSLLDTALRESHEEIALHPEGVELIATLPTGATRMGVKVTPYVGVINPGLEFSPDPQELDSVFSVPLDYLLNEDHLTRDVFPVAGEEYSLPCYHFAGYRIWGFTLGVLVDFLNRSCGASIQLHYPPIKARINRS